MPCGLGFLNGDFPPPFFLSPFSHGHRFGFQSAVWIPNREVRAVESLPDLPSPSPLHPCCRCQSLKKRKRCSCQDFSGKERSPVGIPKHPPGNGLYRNSPLTLHLSGRPTGLVGGWKGPAQRHSRLTCRGAQGARRGTPGSMGEALLHPSPILTFQNLLHLLEASVVVVLLLILL